MEHLWPASSPQHKVHAVQVSEHHSFYDMNMPQRIYACVRGWASGFFPPLAMRAAVAKVQVQVSGWVCFSFLLSIHLGLWVPGKLHVYGFETLLDCFSKVAAICYTPTDHVRGLWFYYILTAYLFDYALLVGVNRYLMLRLICISLVANDFEHFSHVCNDLLYILFGVMYTHIFCPFF